MTFSSACEVTSVIVGHYIRVFYLLIYLLTYTGLRTHLLLQTNWQKQCHAVKLVDIANQITVLLQHRSPHAFARHLRIEVDTVLIQVKVRCTFKPEQVRRQVDWRSTGA